jgi:hypothetical protein
MLAVRASGRFTAVFSGFASGSWRRALMMRPQVIVSPMPGRGRQGGGVQAAGRSHSPVEPPTDAVLLMVDRGLAHEPGGRA